MLSVKKGSTKLEFKLMNVTDAIIMLGTYRKLPKTVVRVIVFVHPDDTSAITPESEVQGD